MDCLHAQQLLSEAMDGELIPDEALAEANAHCADCKQCEDFVRGLDLLKSAGDPQASPELLGSIYARIDAEREATAARVLRLEEESGADTSRRTSGGRDLSVSWWRPRFIVFASAALIVVAAVSLSAIGYFGGYRQLSSDSVKEASAPTNQEYAEDRLSGEASPTEDGTASAVAPAPEYTTIDSRLYLLDDEAAATPSTLVTVGPVAGMSREGTTAPVYAYESDKADGSVVIEEDGWVLYRPVLRRFAGSAYQLSTGTVPTTTGQWPDLPKEFATPTEADGSPTFRFFGYDELGVNVYVPASGTAENGFAIAPGTPVDDPAAGNPGWTWWIPAL